MTSPTPTRVRIAAGVIGAALAMCMHAQDFGQTSFDELSPRPADGLTVAGFRFSSPDATFNASLSGPVDDGLVDEHALVGSTASPLGIAFETPPKYFRLSFALEISSDLPSALQITFFDLGDHSLGSESFDTYPAHASTDFPAGEVFKYTWLDFDWPNVKVSRIELDFNGAADNYAIDNLHAQYTGEPIPEPGTWGACAAVATLACRLGFCRRRFATNPAAARV